MKRALPDLSDVVSPSPESGGGNKTPRKTHYVHKANTIGIPSDSDLQDGKNNHHHRSKKNIFEGFKNTLRNKHKSDTVVLEAAAKDNQEKNDFNRRWSDNNHSTVNITTIFHAANVVPKHFDMYSVIELKFSNKIESPLWVSNKSSILTSFFSLNIV